MQYTYITSASAIVYKGLVSVMQLNNMNSLYTSMTHILTEHVTEYVSYDDIIK